MKYKTIMFGILAMSLIVLVTAQAITNFAITPVTFDNSKEVSTSVLEFINFKCDGKNMEVNGTEPDGKWDSNDVSSMVAGCEGVVTEIVKDGLTYKENAYGTKSFDETYLKADECSQGGNTWDSKLETCTEGIAEDIGGELI